eukprot:TRINITY_DN9467_c0_g1_i1.p1 TRINITY_DN9467_c0_g1~~TRINITY_DN9467_c0_g1_i1.p1  ORF type:complete len:247 (-),score=37.90 TRINITY_DN9467_c0_g1_i1:217-957(-)
MNTPPPGETVVEASPLLELLRQRTAQSSSVKSNCQALEVLPIIMEHEAMSYELVFQTMTRFDGRFLPAANRLCRSVIQHPDFRWALEDFQLTVHDHTGFDGDLMPFGIHCVKQSATRWRYDVPVSAPYTILYCDAAEKPCFQLERDEGVVAVVHKKEPGLSYRVRRNTAGEGFLAELVFSPGFPYGGGDGADVQSIGTDRNGRPWCLNVDRHKIPSMGKIILSVVMDEVARRAMEAWTVPSGCSRQ